MKEFLQQLLDHLNRLTYVQISEAHSIRYKAAQNIGNPVVANRINQLKFNTWFLDPVEKRKKQFERKRAVLRSILTTELEKHL